MAGMIIIPRGNKKISINIDVPRTAGNLDKDCFKAALSEIGLRSILHFVAKEIVDAVKKPKIIDMAKISNIISILSIEISRIIFF